MKRLITLAAALICAATLTSCNSNDNSNDNSGFSYGGDHIFGTGEAALADGGGGVARFSNPANVQVDRSGNVFVADYDNSALRAITPSGLVLTLMQRADFQQPFGLTVASDGTVYIQTDANDTGQKDATTGTIWKFNRDTGAVTVVARNRGRPRGILALADGRIAMSDLAHNVISILDPATGTVTPLAGTADQAGYVNGTGAAARFSRPYDLAPSSDGALLVADQTNNVIRKVTLAGVVTTFAGADPVGGAPAAAGSTNGPVAGASFSAPQGLAISGSAVYVSEPGSHLIRKIAGGTVTTQAGNGTAGFVDAQGTAAEFFGLEGISAGPDGKLWVADGNGGDGGPFNRVRFIPLP
jgi:sugar lactone lactonase YvrE